MQQHLNKQLTTVFNPSHLEVIDESANHSGNRRNSHFKIIVVSAKFNNLSLINRHRMINTLFKEELKQIHALAIHTYTKDEWQNKNGAPNSPQCSGRL